MDLEAFVKWVRSLDDSQKAAMAARFRATRKGADERFLDEARAAADAAIRGGAAADSFEEARSHTAIDAAPDDWLDRSQESLAEWNIEVGPPLRSGFEDALRGIAAGDGIGRGHRRVLLEPALAELPDLA